MTDAGAVALASIVSQGHFEELKEVWLDLNSGITDQGMTALARAIDVRGLPTLETFAIHEARQDLDWTGIGARTMVDALIKRCPQLGGTGKCGSDWCARGIRERNNVANTSKKSKRIKHIRL